jgi:hypothetical protein
MTELASASSNGKQQTRPLVREGAAHEEAHNRLAGIKIWS